MRGFYSLAAMAVLAAGAVVTSGPMPISAVPEQAAMRPAHQQRTPAPVKASEVAVIETEKQKWDRLRVRKLFRWGKHDAHRSAGDRAHKRMKARRRGAQ